MKITNADIEPLIQPTRGNLAHIARQLGVTRQSVWQRVTKSEKLTKLVQDQRESMKDDAESSLYKQILNGNIAAIIFYLKTQAHDRGYVEKKHEERQTSDVRDMSNDELLSIIES